MSFIELTDQHHVGVKMIDDQHIKLADMINFMDDALNTGADIGEVKILLNAIIGFTEYHFDEEESYMQRINHRGFKAHKQAHDSLKTHLYEIRNNLEKDDAKLPKTLAKYLKDWFLNHVVELDTQLVPHKDKVTA